MFGCDSSAHSRVSRWKRSTWFATSAAESLSQKRRTLIATSCPVESWRALWTRPNPPEPSSSRISYASWNWVPGARAPGRPTAPAPAGVMPAVAYHDCMADRERNRDRLEAACHRPGDPPEHPPDLERRPRQSGPPPGPAALGQGGVDRHRGGDRPEDHVLEFPAEVGRHERPVVTPPGDRERKSRAQRIEAREVGIGRRPPVRRPREVGPASIGTPPRRNDPWSWSPKLKRTGWIAGVPDVFGASSSSGGSSRSASARGQVVATRHPLKCAWPAKDVSGAAPSPTTG